MPSQTGQRSHYDPAYHWPLQTLVPKSLQRGWVYCLMCEDDEGGCVKIGYSKDPFKRWDYLQATGQMLRPVKRIGVFQAESPRAAKQIESRFHKSFAHRLIQGEWFKFDFKNAEDKKEFNEVSRKHFRLGKWSSFPVSAIEKMKAQ